MGLGNPEGDWSYSSNLSLTLDCRGWSKPHPGRFTAWKETSYRRLGGLQGRSGRVMQISPSPVIRLQTVQVAAIRCSDYATLAHRNIRVPERKGGKPFPEFNKINLFLSGDVKDKQELIPSDRWKEKEHRTSN